MWVEEDPQTGHRACMVTFFPEFEADVSASRLEYHFVLDLSCSMDGEALDNAKKIVLASLVRLPEGAWFNILAFGDLHTDLFPVARPKTTATMQAATAFVTRARPTWGSTALWRPLRSIFAMGHLAKTKNTDHLRAVFVVSDGLVQNEDVVLAAARAARGHTRVFTLGVGPNPAKHFLRSLANLSGGSFELFDASRKSKWERKITTLVANAARPGLTDIAIAWQQLDHDAPPPDQAPAHLSALFYG